MVAVAPRGHTDDGLSVVRPYRGRHPHTAHGRAASLRIRRSSTCRRPAPRRRNRRWARRRCQPRSGSRHPARRGAGEPKICVATQYMTLLGAAALGMVHETPALTASCGRVVSGPEMLCAGGIDSEPRPVIQVRTVAVLHVDTDARQEGCSSLVRDTVRRWARRSRPSSAHSRPGRWRPLQPLQRVARPTSPARVPSSQPPTTTAPTRERDGGRDGARRDREAPAGRRAREPCREPMRRPRHRQTRRR